MNSQVLIDWLSFTVLSTDNPVTVIQDILKLDTSIFTERGYGRNGYRNCLQYDDVSVFYNGREGKEINGNGNEFMGVCVWLSGGGCRTYEQLGGNVLDLAIEVYHAEKVNLTRLDIACDDKGGALDMEEIVRCYYEKCIRSGCRVRECYQRNKGEYAPARTVYMGSRKSNLCFRFYDKAKEHYDPQENPNGYNSHWIRAEMQTRHEVSENVIRLIIKGMVEGMNLGECVAEMFNGHIQFIARDDTNISRCSVLPWWSDFLGTLRGIKVTGTEEKQHVFERKLHWFKRSIAPLASALMRGIGERDFMYTVKESCRRMNTEQENMLRVWIDKGVKSRMLLDDDELFPLPLPPYEPYQTALTFS